MSSNSISPGASGPQCGQRRWGLTTRDGIRQEAPGALPAGAGGKGPAEKVRVESWARPPEAAYLIYS